MSYETQQMQTLCLFNLPPELWVHICRLAVASKGPIQVNSPHDITNTKQTLQQPAITRTCRVIRFETLHIFFATNTFEFHDTADKELVGLSASVKAMIQAARWSSVKNCVIVSKHPMLRSHMVHCFELSNLFSSYRIRLSVLAGEEKFEKRWKERDAITYKLEIEYDDELAGLDGEEWENARRKKSIMRVRHCQRANGGG